MAAMRWRRAGVSLPLVTRPAGQDGGHEHSVWRRLEAEDEAARRSASVNWPYFFLPYLSYWILRAVGLNPVRNLVAFGVFMASQAVLWLLLRWCRQRRATMGRPPRA